MFALISTVDYTVTNLIVQNFPRSPVLDMFFSFLSFQGLTVIVWLIALLFWISREEYYHHKFIWYFILSFGMTTFFVEIVYKNIIQRLRPWVVFQMAQGGCPATYSFPSGHAAGAFSGAVIFAHFDPKRWYWYYLLAALISFSRIYLYCHFTLDVVAGGVFGYSVGAILLQSLHKKSRAKKV